LILNENLLLLRWKTPLKNESSTLIEAVNLSLVKDLDYLVVCIDENNHVVKSYGDTTKYLLQKNFNSNLEELLPKPLKVAFNNLVSDSLKTNKKVTVKGIKIKHGKLIAKVSLSVRPLTFGKREQKLLMVTFSDDVLMITDTQEDKVFDEKIYHDQYTKKLRGGVEGSKRQAPVHVRAAGCFQ